MNKTYILDTTICSFIMHEQPEAVIKRLEHAVLRNHRMPSLIPKCTLGLPVQRPSPRHPQLVDAFCARLDAILPWDRTEVDATTDIKVALRRAGRSIGPNDTAIAGRGTPSPPCW